MDSGIIFALVLAVLFFGGVIWLVVHSRKEGQKHRLQTSINPKHSQTKDRAA